eukprot:CAMPEP_0198210534 /NCGR_PEP_ID=MMETSP1445-20131203/20478_1 /TAXON_ID=36898 /ORGANISM="Pyramimonas sp., Strain CCMP2087" /LENGTH=465 /DNA_ID=CAMNT_0043884617 /DNA_START=58 /DNA_END=1452 /DNA_ORIENTATION=+
MAFQVAGMNSIRCLRPIAQTAACSSPAKHACIAKHLGFAKNVGGSTRKLQARKFSRSTMVAKVSADGVAVDRFEYTEDEIMKKQKQIQRKFLVEKNLVAPQPALHQQTVRSSFIRKGVGLHSGAPVTVRVRPALAGEGRYFVIVPSGTIDDEETFPDDTELSPEEAEEVKLEFFKMSLLDDEEREQREKELFPDMDLNLDKPAEQEAAVKGTAGETRIPAHLNSVVSERLTLCTKLTAGGATVSTVEHLLSALEASGVDNARIEVEDGFELPILDGSADGWVSGIVDCGVVAAETAGGERMPRKALQPKLPIVVQNGDSFIMLNPEAKTRLTYIVDFTQKSTAIGKQTFSWCQQEDHPYGMELALARTFTTMEDVEVARAAGLIKGGSPVNALIADGSEYFNPPLRYNEEPVRHKMLDLIGDLALMAEGGNGGLPTGHVVAYKAGHDLHVKFAKALVEASKAADW